jgi:glutamate formiminotransferase
VLECVPNVSEGRDDAVLDALSAACARALLDRHVDRDHHRSVFTLAGAGVLDAVRALAGAVAERVDLRAHTGVHPRFGALDVVPFVALHDERAEHAVTAAHEFAAWIVDTLAVPVFLYDDADAQRRSLPDARRDAFVRRHPDLGPSAADPALGAVAVGARRPLVAVNCELTTADVGLARRIASAVRERDGGLVGVRALGLRLDSVARAQVSMNLVALERTGLERACTGVRDLARAEGADIARVELVGLLPAAELDRCSAAFREWSGIGPDRTVEARLG